jgi:hypothetical protein
MLAKACSSIRGKLLASVRLQTFIGQKFRSGWLAAGGPLALPHFFSLQATGDGAQEHMQCMHARKVLTAAAGLPTGRVLHSVLAGRRGYQCTAAIEYKTSYRTYTGAELCCKGSCESSAVSEFGNAGTS